MRSLKSSRHNATAISPQVTDKMKIAVMQPTYLPWLGYFDLIDQVDLFVFLDNVQFDKRSWQQRNRIKTTNGLKWLTVPVTVKGRYKQLICQAEINDSFFWKKHLGTIESNYKKSKFYQEYFQPLKICYKLGISSNLLAEHNIMLIEWLAEKIGIKKPFTRASCLKVSGKRSNLLSEICMATGANEYLSPMGSAGYLLKETKEFYSKGIKVYFQNYQHPEYNQMYPPFLPFASSVDLLFNEGPESLNIIQSGRMSSYNEEEIRSEFIKKCQDNEQGSKDV